MIQYKKGPMSPVDYDRLRQAVGWSSYTNTEIEEGLRDSLFIIVGFDGDRAVAMGRVIGDGKLAFYIQDVIVLPEYQRQGIGKRIMREILDYIDSRSVNNSTIGLMSAFGKDKFYEDLGFIKRPNETMGSGMNIWVKKG